MLILPTTKEKDMTGINGWISHLTKNTASARMNFDVSVTDEEILSALYSFLFTELRRSGRSAEARRDLWDLKDGIERDYPLAGKSSARIRLRRKSEPVR
jgi:hypothetical protein